MPGQPKDGYKIDSSKTWWETVDDLEVEFRRWGVKKTDVAITRDGKRAMVRWFVGERPIQIEADDQDTAANNLRKLYLVVESIRLNEKRGFAQIARTYYAALPAGEPDPYEVLGVRRQAKLSTIEGAWRALAKEAHPDKGGDTAEAARINRAWEMIKAERKADEDADA